MMSERCECQRQHLEHRIVLTGGPGAGKTAVLEIVRHSLCEHIAIVPEAAGVVFGGGFPRTAELGVRRAAQRAIYHVQLELEAATIAKGASIMLCDRGAVDGWAYWPGPDDFWKAVGTSREAVLSRYEAVIHLRVPDAQHGYGRQNPLRIETAIEAQQIDERIMRAWEGHPRVVIIEAAPDFIEKGRRTLEALRSVLPQCCRDHASRAS